MQRAGTFAIATAVVWMLGSLAVPVEPVAVHVRWAPAVSNRERVDLEKRFELLKGEQSDGTTWTYQLADASTRNIAALVRHPNVEDTAGLDRTRYRPSPEIGWMQRYRLPMLSIASISGALVLTMTMPLLLAIVGGMPARTRFRFPSRAELIETFRSNQASVPAAGWRGTLTVGALFAVLSGLLAYSASAPFLSALGSFVLIYVGGYVAGSLLVAAVDSHAFAIVRTVAGLMLTAIGFLLSLVASLPWFLGPAVIVGCALVVRRRRALVWSDVPIEVGWDGVTTAVLCTVLLAPVCLAFFRMGQGPFPAVFYNLDSPYVLEKVHALVLARSFPPPSLSNLGVTRTYHYGVHAMAALVSRGSGLLPHQALFLIVLPLLATGLVASAVVAARFIAPAIPLCVAVPLLLIAAPQLSRPFADSIEPPLRVAVQSGRFTPDVILSDVEPWGVLSNEAQNTDFPIVSSIAAIAAAPAYGWLLPAFLIGTSVLFKTTTGIALVAGFMLAEAWRMLRSKVCQPSGAMLLVGAIFVTTFSAFYLASFDSAVRVQLYPFEHVRSIITTGRPVTTSGAVVDLVWLLLPLLVVFTASRTDMATGRLTVPFFLMGLAPLLVVNVSSLVSAGRGGMGAGPEDWFQIPHPVPFFVRAAVLALASALWTSRRRWRRAAFLVACLVIIAPVVIAAGTYSVRLLRSPERGHEFADNRSIAQALAVIPTRGSVIVTNDLRYPADHFGRDDRQMQIPALFGHQAFSSNFAYEPLEDRRPLQRLLQQREWSAAIVEAARTHHWTHFLVRKDFAHPVPIPLPQIFENEDYVVYRFPHM